MNEAPTPTAGAQQSGQATDLSHYAGQYLTFMLDKEFYGVAILRVQEIIGVQDITRIPESPEFVRGVINLRGQVIPVLDLRLRFGMEGKDYDDETCVIIVEIGKSSVGMIVDKVDEVVGLRGNAIEPAPSFGADIDNSYLLAMGKTEDRVVILIDCDRVLRFGRSSQQERSKE